MVKQRWRGIVKDGAIVLEEPIPLPDGTPVVIVPEGKERHEVDWENDPFLRVDEWTVPSQIETAKQQGGWKSFM
ncbi:hypothetical protein GG496_000222 [Candidatus Fervidibacteria bacterium JGI MDM2 JNZ-1-D12]